MRATSRCATSKGQTGDQQAFIVGGIAPGVSTERVWNHYYTLVVSADEETARSAIRRDTRLGFAFVAETATLKCWMRREGRLFVARRKVEGDVALMVVCTGRRHGAPLTSRRLALVNVHEALRRLAQTEPLLAAQLPSNPRRPRSKAVRPADDPGRGVGDEPLRRTSALAPARRTSGRVGLRPQAHGRREAPSLARGAPRLKSACAPWSVTLDGGRDTG